MGPAYTSCPWRPTPLYYMDDYSSLTAAPRSVLYTGDGTEFSMFREPDTAGSDYDILPTEIVHGEELRRHAALRAA